MARMTWQGNQISAPAWMADFGSRDHLLPFPARADYTKFADAASVVVTVGSAGAAQGATSIPIAALTTPFLAATTVFAAGGVLIPAGAVLDFGGAKFAVLTADAILGATALTVRALPTAVVSGDVANYSVGGSDVILSGTPVGRTYAQRDANGLFLPGLPTHDELFLVAFDVANARQNPDIELYRPPSVVKENYLPGYAVMAADAGIADPAAAPVLGHAGSDGPSAAGVRYVGYTFTSAYGETRLSPLASTSTLTTEHVSIADIAFPTGATGIKFYSSPAPGDINVAFNKELAAHAATTLTADGTGNAPPPYNTSQGPSGSLLAALRRIYRCIKGVD